MQCPVCKIEYKLEEIESHVDQCLQAISEVSIDSTPRLKRQLSHEDKKEENTLKRPKTSSVISVDYKQFNTSRNTQNKPNTKMTNKDYISLAERMRPSNLTEYIGQEQIVGSNMVLQQLLRKGHIPSMILWGPPGCGKSSLANVIACMAKEIHDKVKIIRLSAVTSGVANIREAVGTAKNEAKIGRRTIVFMDEIPRFNKLQQDIFLPHVEAGTFTLIGTTTENPSYSLNSALLSRCRVFALNKLTVPEMTEILCKGIKQENGKILNSQDSKGVSNRDLTEEFRFSIDQEVINWLAEVCDGDARVALNALELAIKTQSTNKYSLQRKAIITLDNVRESLKQTHMLHDKQTNHTHHLYSALHKSIQAGNANAALYWLARIMAIREDPVDIARRLVRISSEDVGLADPDALGVAVDTLQGCEMIGMPECDVLLGQCVVYLCKAEKSRLMYDALNNAKKLISEHKGPQPSVPLHIRCRSGEGKLQASLGENKSNLLREEEDSKSRLPRGLENVNFFMTDFLDVF